MSKQHSRNLPTVLWAWALAASCLTLFCLAAEFICHHIPALNRVPYSRATLEAQLDYIDYSMFNTRFLHFHTKDFFDPRYGNNFLYPAPVAVIYAAIHELTAGLPHQTSVFLLLVLGTTLALTVLLFRQLTRVGINSRAAAIFALITLFTSYPFFFEFNRGNLELIVWLMAGAGVWAFAKGHYRYSAMLIGVAGSLKLYPYIYLGLFIASKKYKEAAAALLIGGMTTLLSLWLTTGNIFFTAHHVSAGVAEFRYFYVLHRRWQEIGLDHSLFGAMKFFMPTSVGPSVLEPMLTIYLIVAGASATLLFFLRIRKMSFINQVIFLTAASIVLPPVSYDYTLLHVYTPWVCMVFYVVTQSLRSENIDKSVWFAFVCFALLLTPQNEFIFRGERLEGVAKCLTLLVLILIAARYSLQNKTVKGTVASS